VYLPLVNLKILRDIPKICGCEGLILHLKIWSAVLMLPVQNPRPECIVTLYSELISLFVLNLKIQKLWDRLRLGQAGNFRKLKDKNYSRTSPNSSDINSTSYVT
jgi:hypothetical protein